MESVAMVQVELEEKTGSFFAAGVSGSCVEVSAGVCSASACSGFWNPTVEHSLRSRVDDGGVYVPYGSGRAPEQNTDIIIYIFAFGIPGSSPVASISFLVQC